MLLSIEKAHKYAHLIELPYLILHGLKDQITPIKDSIQIISNISSKHKKLVKFEDGYHELHHDEEQ
jgi:alpha-beta hydrolase superfamily lysophospholipase